MYGSQLFNYSYYKYTFIVKLRYLATHMGVHSYKTFLVCYCLFTLWTLYIMDSAWVRISTYYRPRAFAQLVGTSWCFHLTHILGSNRTTLTIELSKKEKKKKELLLTTDMLFSKLYNSSVLLWSSVLLKFSILISFTWGNLSFSFSGSVLPVRLR